MIQDQEFPPGCNRKPPDDWLQARRLQVCEYEHGRIYGQKDLVFDNAKFSLSNRRFMGAASSGSGAAEAGHNAS